MRARFLLSWKFIIGTAFTLFLALGILIPLFAPARKNYAYISCANNLSRIYLAKGLWKSDTGATNGAVPPTNVVEAYGQGRVVCPNGGRYDYGAVGEGPSCSCGRRLNAQGEFMKN